VLGLVEHSPRLACFDDGAIFHDRCAIANGPHDGQIMADEETAETVPLT
jgi:hypothetical protein